VAHNEEGLIQSIIGELRKQLYSGECEIIVADGGSTDETIPRAKREGVSIVQCRKGKACQMNDAAKIAHGDILFFVHADMKLDEGTLVAIQQQIDNGFDAGGFSNVFDAHNEKIKNLGTWMNSRFFDNREQSDKGIFYGDNGIFVKKRVFQALGGFKEIPIMEDYDLSIRLGQQHKVVKIEQPPIVVSARRHINAGFVKTRLQWIAIRKLYQWGVPTEFLAKWYGDVR